MSLKEVTLYFVAGALLLSVLQVTGALVAIQGFLTPLTVGWLQLRRRHPTPSSWASCAATSAPRGCSDARRAEEAPAGGRRATGGRPGLPDRRSGASAAGCPLLTCSHCGLKLETFAFRCPRCLGDIPLGCSGNCRSCGKGKG
jgi:hypothetical protein